MGLITYPPKQHQTDSKTIFFIGFAEKRCIINDKPVKLAPNGNFAHIVKLKLGKNRFDIEIDDEKFQRVVEGVKAEYPHPVAYGQLYESFPPENPSRKNILRSILVAENSIVLPLNIAPIYQLERHSKYKYFLDLQETEMDLDWIHYQIEDSPIIIGEVIKSRIPIIFRKPVASIAEQWEDNSLVLDIKYYAQDFAVCIDPGHGGEQFGSCSPKGIYEKDLNLSFARLLQDELRNLSIHAEMTRTEDVTMSLEERIDFAEEHDSMVFLSIHHNALPDARDPNLERGASTHYYHEQSKPFAKYLLNKVCEHSELDFYGLFRQNLHVLRENQDRISVLLELGYLIHPLESELIASPEFQAKTARIVAKAISNFFRLAKD
jgi:N-acetylmuramoyl-L-alanine amidase